MNLTFKQFYLRITSLMRIEILMLISFSLLLSQETYTFNTCGQEGRYGPSQEQCDMEYADDNLSGMVIVPSDSGIQYWVVPGTGIYSIEVAAMKNLSALEFLFSLKM